MRASEVVGWGDLLGAAIARGARHVERTHLAIADRVFDALDRALPGTAVPTRVLHQGVTRGVHTSVRAGGLLAGRLAGRAVALRWPADAPEGFGRPGLDGTRAAIVGLIGDQLADAGNAVAWPMTVRTGGLDIDLDPPAIAAAHTDPTGRLAVFVHGLCEDERAWRYRSLAWWGEEGSTHGSRLAEHGWTPVYVRYPSGQPIDENGHDLARVLDRLVTAWPVEVERVALVGHSMGGLVVRGALHRAMEQRMGWTGACRDVVCLGAPLRGAHLARVAAAAAVGLGRFPEMAAAGDFLEHRSVGVRDLEQVRDVAHVDGVDLHLVAAHLGRRGDGRAAATVGDLLVDVASATGEGLPGVAAATTVRRFPGLHHLDLLNHPNVHDHLVELLV